MTLAELGAGLKEERIVLGLMVEDVAARLKVPARILRAIEDGSVNELPHSVYTRGFIKGYANILGYSNEKITALMDSLEEFDDDFASPRTVEARPLGEDSQHKRGGGFKLLLKLIVLALIAGGGYAYYTHTFRNGDVPVSLPSYGSNSNGNVASLSPPPPSTPLPAASVLPSAPPPAPSSPAVPSVPAASVDVPAVSGPEASNASASPTPSAPPNAPSRQAAATEPSTATAAEAPVRTAPIPPEERTEATPVATSGFEPLDPPAASSEAASVFGTSTLPAALPDGMHQLVLTAEEECWVHANADGTVTREFSLQKGETFAMPFKTSLVLKLGNAGGVRIKYDGKDIPSPGRSGQVKTINFPPRG